LGGCAAPEPQFILHTRVVEAERTVEVTREVTRVLVEVVTATPAPPPVVRVGYLARGGVPEALATLLGEGAGCRVELVAVADEAEGARALCAGQVDMVAASVPAYLLAQAACGAEARLVVVREGVTAQVGQLLVQADSARQARQREPLRTLAGLQGKSIAYVDPAAESGYLYAKALLADAKVKTGEEVFVGGEAQAVLAVYRGEVDAAAATWQPMRADGSIGDARALLAEAYPDVGQVVKILRLTAPIPNGPVVLRRELEGPLKERLVATLLGLTRTAGGVAALRAWCGGEGVAMAGDKDYDGARRMVSALGLDLAAWAVQPRAPR
jgi:ABC-type phosphate/phosphonate transport system substrate-binding protein